MKLLKVAVRAVMGIGLLAAVLSAFPSVASAADPAVWVGAPLNATWPNSSNCAGATYPSNLCSLPSVHHNPFGGHWAADLQSVPAGAAVRVYAAPQNGSTPITAVVEIVRPACRSGDLSRGGHRVTVGFYAGSTKIGTATYAHINASVRQGATISRWGTVLGTVGTYTSGSCWDGRHVHFEMYSQHSYACYNRGWRPGQQMYASNFVGFIGGAYASGPRRPCP